MEPRSLDSTTSVSSPPVEPSRVTTITTNQNGMCVEIIVFGDKIHAISL